MTILFRTCSALTLLALPTISCGCAIAPPVEETRTTTVASVPGQAIDIRTVNGGVSVVRADHAEVSITAKIRAGDETRLKAIGIVSRRGADGTLHVSVDWPDGTCLGNEGVSFEITLPEARGVDIESTNGVISILGLTGEAKLVTSNGSVKVAQHDGPANIRTSNAPVEVESLRGDLVAKSSNAPVTVGATTGIIDVSTSNGPMNVEPGPEQRGAVTASTSNATVGVVLAEGSTGPVTIRTSNAGVSLRVAGTFNGRLKASTSNGKIRHSGAVKVIRLDGHSGEFEFGAGGPESTVHTSNGGVSIEAR